EARCDESRRGATGSRQRSASRVHGARHITLTRRPGQQIIVCWSVRNRLFVTYLSGRSPFMKIGHTLISAALVTVYGCGKEESKKAEAPKAGTTAAAPAEETVTVKIGHAGPLTGG